LGLNEAAFRAVASMEDVREGFVTRIDVEGVPVVLTRLDNQVRAFDGTCTHAEFELETSRLVRGCIECPMHGARFSAVDGEVVKGPAKEPLPEIPCRVDGDQVLLAPDWF
jgi:nitrite reductase/ring-hydroxylating ferredoxin subunit